MKNVRFVVVIAVLVVLAIIAGVYRLSERQRAKKYCDALASGAAYDKLSLVRLGEGVDCDTLRFHTIGPNP